MLADVKRLLLQPTDTTNIYQQTIERLIHAFTSPAPVRPRDHQLRRRHAVSAVFGDTENGIPGARRGLLDALAGDAAA